MILIADCGSTTCEWSTLSGTESRRVLTQGISPYFLTTGQICSLLEAELLPRLPEQQPSQVFYYGTGCTGPATVKIVADALCQLFPQAIVQVTYDLVSAAHALCGNEKGIACILGTGCNSGYYNGKEIERNSPGLGYVLGDEGSGSHLGKMLIRKYLYDEMEPVLKQQFESRFEVSSAILLKNVYSVPLANRYLASFSIFLSEHRKHAQVESILKEGLDDFFRVHISSYEQCRDVPVHFVGSIAWGYSDVIRKLGEEHGFRIGMVVKEPMDGLLAYYSQKL